MLRRFPEVLILNALTPVADADSTVTVVSGGLYIKGYGTILDSEIIACSKICTTAAVKQVSTVAVTIPTSCECPYEWGITLQANPCTKAWGIFNTFVKDVYYSFVNPDGTTPTQDQAGQAVADQITNDPFGIATASYAAGVITITERNASVTCGFKIFADSGTVAYTGGATVLHVGPVLDTEAMQRLFPIKWGSVGSAPSLPIPGAEYCAYTFVLRKNADIQDLGLANGYQAYEREVTFYVCKTPTTGVFTTDWATPVNTAFTCITS